MWGGPFPVKAWLGRSNKGRTHGPAAQTMWGRQTAPRGQAAKPQILRRAPLWSAPAGRLYGSGLLRTQDTIELAVRFCSPIHGQASETLAASQPRGVGSPGPGTSPKIRHKGTQGFAAAGSER